VGNAYPDIILSLRKTSNLFKVLSEFRSRVLRIGRGMLSGKKGFEPKPRERYRGGLVVERGAVTNHSTRGWGWMWRGGGRSGWVSHSHTSAQPRMRSGFFVE
jgi:hypothetical protein